MEKRRERFGYAVLRGEAALAAGVMKYHLPFHRQPACSLLANQGLDVPLNEEVNVKRKISNRNSAEDAETGSPGSEQFLEGLLLRAADLKATVETRIHFGSG